MDIQTFLPFIVVFILVILGFIAYQRGRGPKKPEVKEETAIEKRWKEFLAERSETLVDGVFGLVLGLGAYSLTGFTIGGLEDVMVAVSYFALTFLLICMFWWGTSKWFAVAEYSDVLMGINFLFILLLALMPFFLRLMFFMNPVVKDVGVTLFPLTMGALLSCTLLANILILRQNREIPAEVRGDLKRGLFVFPMMAALFFSSLLIPADATTQMYVQKYLPQYETSIPEPLRNYPFRVVSWWLIIVLVMTFSGLAEVVQKRRAHASEREVSSPKEWRKTLTKKCRTISDSVYGLALGLCAYSLTDYAISGMGDIVIALSFFLLTFFLVGMFWMELYRTFVMVPLFDDTLVATNLVLTFFVTLVPFSLRLAMVPGIAARNVGMALFPLNMIAAGVTSSAFITLSLHRRTVEIPKDDVMELQRFAVAIPALAFIYIASFWIPSDAAIPPQYARFIPEPLTILKTLPFRVVIWWFSLIPLIAVMGIVELIQEEIARRSKS